jgi:hypothetical protein
MWNGIIKNDENHNKLNFLIWTKIKLENFQCILQLNYSFYGGLFYFILIYYYDIFLSPHFSFSMCEI